MIATQAWMTGFPKRALCKDGTAVTLRPMAKGDEERVRRFFAALPKADRAFLRDDVTDPGVIARWFEHLDYQVRLPLMALDGDEVVGHALLDAARPSWSLHVAEIRLVVATSFQRRGLGTVLTHELVDLARRRGLDKVMAQMMDTQTSARHMFERIGFSVEAELKHHVKDLDGKKHSLVIMTCPLDAAWDRMEEVLQDSWRFE